MLRHFLSLTDLRSEELDQILRRAIEIKTLRRQGQPCESLKGKVLGLVFEKSSTRTRVSFESGIFQLGGAAIFLSPRDTQLGRGEPIEDTARVLSRMVDIIAVRTFGHEILERFAQHSTVPVINALSDKYHPCQVLADVQTFIEQRGDICGAQVAWIGDGNNMCNSFINAARLLRFDLRVACPRGYEPDEELAKLAGDRLSVVHDPGAAVDGADLVVTDVWASMGQETEQRARKAAFEGFQVNSALMSRAKADALVMHCLPAHRGEEIAADVIDGPNSVVWDEAENRLHAQKALMEFLLSI
ncbi:MAG TPA: ornithine carbamoyltransferase [Gammaproteobacteria bacterium]|nr:ornithine carbamoyltransferase [Gammaproteobacteria bacterium]